MQNELTKDEESTQAEQNNTYDEVPYESFPYDYTHPENLCVIGRLFRIKAKNPDTSRILDIGCASGGNIIPLAIRYPKSECVGIDLSQKQINTGNQVIGDLGLENIVLKHMSVDAVGSDMGKFDYIICHGVLSWVTDDIQEKILEGCKKLLTKNGLAMISYNTLPGWNAVRSVRDMMLFHSAPVTNPNEKISKCRAFLNFILNNFDENTDDPYYKVIKKELAIMDNTSHSYFFHEHLESENHPMYFHQFCAKATNAGLQYVSNTDLRSMYIGNYKPEVGKFLEPIENDINRTEQYLDFISNRRFRSSIICHDDVMLNRHIEPHEFSDYCISTDLRPKAALMDDLLDSSEIIQLSHGGLTLSVGTKLDKAIVKVLSERYYRPIPIENLARKVQQMLGENSLEEVTRAVSATCLKMLLNGAFTVHLEEGDYLTEVSEKPRASSYAQYQSSRQDWVTNLRCRKVKLGILEKTLLQHLDGKNDFSKLIEKILEVVEKGQLKVKENNAVITDKVLIGKRINELVRNSLQILAQNALLVS